MAIGKQSVVADANKPHWQDVHEEAADKFLSLESHGFLTAALLIVPIRESHFSIVSAKQTVVGNGDTMGVTGKVVKDFFRAVKRRFYIYYPFCFTAGLQKLFKGLRRRKRFNTAVEFQLAFFEGLSQ